MKSACLAAAALVGTLWLHSLPYRLSPLASRIAWLVGLAVIGLYAAGLLVGILEVSTAKDKANGFLGGLAVVLGIGGLVFMTAFYGGSHASTSNRNRCISNLRKGVKP